MHCNKILVKSAKGGQMCCLRINVPKDSQEWFEKQGGFQNVKKGMVILDFKGLENPKVSYSFIAEICSLDEKTTY